MRLSQFINEKYEFTVVNETKFPTPLLKKLTKAIIEWKGAERLYTNSVAREKEVYPSGVSPYQPKPLKIIFYYLKKTRDFVILPDKRPPELKRIDSSSRFNHWNYKGDAMRATAWPFSNKIDVAMPPVDEVDTEKFTMILSHEIDHLLGLNHREMENEIDFMKRMPEHIKSIRIALASKGE